MSWSKRFSAIIPAPGKHTASLIFLHGLGDVGESWLDEFKVHQIPKKFPYVKFIFPTAPIRNITVNNGMPMTGWYDSYGLDRTTKRDEEGVLQASQYLNSLIGEEIQGGLPVERIIIGGFSMGGAVVLHTALTSPHVMAGVLALSTYIPLMDIFPQALVAGDRKVNLPILQCHGNADEIVRIYWARLAEQKIRSMGFQRHVFIEYDGLTHASCNQEMKDIAAFIGAHLPKID